jgi:glycosyltransferase involved in cell wall biosynthesis
VTLSEDGYFMRVLYVIPGQPEGSEFIFAKRQIACLESAGVASRKFFLTSRTSILFLISAISRLREEIADFQPDIVHAQFGTVNAMVCVCAGASPLVVTFRGGDLNPTREVSRLRSLVGRFLSQITALRATAIVCVTDRLRSRLWWKQGKCRVIPNGVDLSKFVPMSREKARSILSWHQEKRVILFNAGRNAQAKRLDLAMAAVERVRLQMNDIHIEVLRGDILPDRVPLYLNAADCLLVTSDWEGSPNIVKEALACNLPIVAVDAGDISERIAGVSVSRITERSPEALGQCLVEILQENRISNGRDKVANLSDRAIARQILEIYHNVMGESRSAMCALNPTVADPSQDE